MNTKCLSFAFLHVYFCSTFSIDMFILKAHLFGFNFILINHSLTPILMFFLFLFCNLPPLCHEMLQDLFKLLFYFPMYLFFFRVHPQQDLFFLLMKKNAVFAGACVCGLTKTLHYNRIFVL